MPYLQVDLDGKRKWPLVAAGCGVPEGSVYKGFLDLWEMCWRDRRDTVGVLRLEMLFGAPGERVAQVLCELGFLDAAESGFFRVKGADKYLRIAESRSLAGKSRVSGAVRGKNGRLKAKKRKPDQQVLAPAPASAGEPTSKPPALTPNTEHHSPNTEQKTIAPSAPDGAYQPLVDRLFAAFRAVHGRDPQPSGLDWKKLKELRVRAKDDAEIVVRFARGLVAQYGRHVDTFTELFERWDKLASADPPTRAGNARDVTRGMVRAQDVDKSTFEKTGILHDF